MPHSEIRLLWKVNVSQNYLKDSVYDEHFCV